MTAMMERRLEVELKELREERERVEAAIPTSQAIQDLQKYVLEHQKDDPLFDRYLSNPLIHAPGALPFLFGFKLRRSKEERQQRKISQSIEATLAADRKQPSIYHILVTGHEGPGKRTFIRQIQLLRGSGFTRAQRKAASSAIVHRCIEAIKRILNPIKDAGSFNNQLDECQTDADRMKLVWTWFNHRQVQESIRELRQGLSTLPDMARYWNDYYYFLDPDQRARSFALRSFIANPTQFIPSIQDYLRLDHLSLDRYSSPITPPQPTKPILSTKNKISKNPKNIPQQL